MNRLHWVWGSYLTAGEKGKAYRAWIVLTLRYYL